MIQVVHPGAHATVQDFGRVGYAAWGFAPGGAADRGSLALANRLVGNPDDAAAFEMLLGGATLLFHDAALIAVTGATCAVTVDRLSGRCNGPQHVPAGALVALATPQRGVRTYLAVRGGIATQPQLGSRSIDERSGLGRALRAGDLIPVGGPPTGAPAVDVAPTRAWPTEPIVLDAVLGPRDDWFTEESVRRFATESYTVGAASDRVGIRLEGLSLTRRTAAELLSEPTLRGAVEVPADGQPIVFGADHPSTCGYPVIAVLDPHSADVAAQCRPGQVVTFDLGPGRRR